MEFRFQRGQHGFRRVPVMHMLGWRRVKDAPNGAVFRPGAGTIPYRLLYLALGAVLMAITHFALTPLMAEREAVFTEAERAQIRDMQLQANELARELSESDRERIAARAATRAEGADRLQQQDSLFREGVRYAYTGLMALFGVLGLLPVVSLAWNRVTIWQDAGNRLMINRWGVFPKTHALPLAALGGLRVVAREHIERRSAGRYASRPVSTGWRWRIRLDNAAGGTAVEFVLEHQRERPRAGGRPPEAVRHLAETLQRLTGLSCAPPTVEDDARFAAGSTGPMGGPVRIQRDTHTTTIPLDDPAALDQLPPAMRAQVEAALRGEPTGVDVAYRQSHTITVQDASGKVHHYGSPEEMPPDLRALYERARRQGGQSGTIPNPWE